MRSLVVSSVLVVVVVVVVWSTSALAAGQGALCSVDTDCDTGRCIDAADEPAIRYCSQTCTTNADCATGIDGKAMRCVGTTDPKVDVCIYDGPSPTAVGWSCTMGTDCHDGVCADGTCTKVCVAAGGADCPLGYTCDGSYDQSGSQPETICIPASKSSGCEVGGHGAASGAALILLAMLTLGTARRGRGRVRS
jgi:hypothetical protein